MAYEYSAPIIQLTTEDDNGSFGFYARSIVSGSNGVCALSNGNVVVLQWSYQQNTAPPSWRAKIYFTICAVRTTHNIVAQGEVWIDADDPNGDGQEWAAVVPNGTGFRVLGYLFDETLIWRDFAADGTPIGGLHSYAVPMKSDLFQACTDIGSGKTVVYYQQPYALDEFFAPIAGSNDPKFLIVDATGVIAGPTIVPTPASTDLANIPSVNVTFLSGVGFLITMQCYIGGDFAATSGIYGVLYDLTGTLVVSTTPLYINTDVWTQYAAQDASGKDWRQSGYWHRANALPNGDVVISTYLSTNQYDINGTANSTSRYYTVFRRVTVGVSTLTSSPNTAVIDAPIYRDLSGFNASPPYWNSQVTSDGTILRTVYSPPGTYQAFSIYALLRIDGDDFTTIDQNALTWTATGLSAQPFFADNDRSVGHLATDSVFVIAAPDVAVSDTVTYPQGLVIFGTEGAPTGPAARYRTIWIS